MMVVKPERTIVKLAVTKKGHAALKSISERYGMKEYIVGGKLLDWFGQQDDVFQRAVLGLLEGLERDAAAEFMRRFGEGKEPPEGNGGRLADIPAEEMGSGVYTDMGTGRSVRPPASKPGPKARRPSPPQKA